MIADTLLKSETQLAVIGLGYVGLPLAIEFGKRVPTVGLDINQKRIEQLKAGHDETGEVNENVVEVAPKIRFTSDPTVLKDCRFIIVAVPTPIDQHKCPDLNPLTSVSRMVGEHIQPNTIVVFESTVYPGVTEDICAPIIEEVSGLKCGQDFWIGYSPERINPGDREHNVTTILKIVSGMNENILEEVAAVYDLVIKAGLYKAKSIKTAEAAKVIENVQRDLNIALVNELSMMFQMMDIDTRDVLEAAATKWNFIKMYPGLVGGHCIGVDPYYLTFKAEAIGYQPQVILAGRRINDGMGKYIAEMTVKKMIEANKIIKGSRALVCGITFKENVSDIRNSKVIDVIRELNEYGVEVLVTDPLASAQEVKSEYGLDLITYDPTLKVDAVVVTVAHNAFAEKLTPKVVANHLSSGGAVMDVKALFSPNAFANDALIYWRL